MHAPDLAFTRKMLASNAGMKTILLYCDLYIIGYAYRSFTRLQSGFIFNHFYKKVQTIFYAFVENCVVTSKNSTDLTADHVT